jgi:hypothetical protein
LAGNKLRKGIYQDSILKNIRKIVKHERKNDKWHISQFVPKEKILLLFKNLIEKKLFLYGTAEDVEFYIEWLNMMNTRKSCMEEFI